MLTGNIERSSTINLRARPALRWLAIALLVFAQLSFASHVHELDEAVNHECTLCSQLSAVEHGSAGHAVLPLLPVIADFAAAPERSGSAAGSDHLLPPSRAPPVL